MLISVLVVMTTCNSDEKIKGFKTHEILVVTLNIDDNVVIEKIILKSSFKNHSDSILKHEIGDKKIIKLKCPQKGEGTFSICVYTSKDTLCSQEEYCEGGYRPKMNLKEHRLILTKI